MIGRKKMSSTCHYPSTHSRIREWETTLTLTERDEPLEEVFNVVRSFWASDRNTPRSPGLQAGVISSGLAKDGILLKTGVSCR